MIEEFSKIKGFLEQKEGKALYEACKFSFKTGKCAEIGSYCGKSACYIGLACKEVGSKLYSVDHHRGSEEQQYMAKNILMRKYMTFQQIKLIHFHYF